MIKAIKNLVTHWRRCRSNSYWSQNLKHLGTSSYVDPTVHCLGMKNVSIGNHCSVGQDTLINVNHRESGVALSIGDFCYIARRNFFSTGRKIVLGDYVLTGLNNAFLGSGHVISDPTRPFILTPTTDDGTLEVQENCWLGSLVTISGNLTIGYGSVVGANSLVLKSVPPFSLSLGSPSKVIKRYSFLRKQWVDVEEFTSDDEGSLPSRESYREMLKQNSGPIKMPHIANSIQWGNL